MRVDASPDAARRQRSAQVAAALVILAIGVVIGWALDVQRVAADGTLLGAAHNLIDGSAADRLPQLLLDIHFRALQSLRERRLAWRAQGQRPAPDPGTVAARLRLGETQQDVALSLLGPPQSRSPTELGRLLVDVHGEGDFAGMRTFALEDPSAPELLRELILYHELTRVGAVAPRALAVGVRANNDRWGVAVAVEQPSQAMLRAAHRPLGALVGWAAIVPQGMDLDAGLWLPEPQAARWSAGAHSLQGTPVAAHTAWAQARLDGLRAGVLAPEDVLDVEATARLIALAELTGLADRALTWHNLRWYLNPVSLRLEPVLALTPERAEPQVDAHALLPRLLASPPLRTALTTMLRADAERLLAPDAQLRVERYFAGIWPTLAMAVWQREWLVVRQRALRLLAAERVPTEPPLPAPTVYLPQPVTDAHAALPFAVDAGLPEAHALRIPPGVWTVPQTVALPDGWRLELAAGAQLRLGPGAWLVLRGGLTVAGTAAAPVELAAQGSQAWGGVVVLGTHQSHVQHLRVTGANGLGRDVWQPGAALVWLNGDVEVDALQLIGMPGQLAGLRVVGGQLRGQDVVVREVPGAGIQLDGGRVQLGRLTVAQGGEGVAVTDGSLAILSSHGEHLRGAWLTASGEGRAELANATVSDAAAVVRAQAGAWVRVVGAKGDVRDVAFTATDAPGRSGKPAVVEASGVHVTARGPAACTGGAAIELEGKAQACGEATP